MTDTLRRRAPLPTRDGTLKLKPRAAGAAEAAPQAPDSPKPNKDWRKPAAGSTGRNRAKASFPEQANAEPERRSPRPFRDGDAPRQGGERFRDDRPRSDRPRDDRPPRPTGDRPARPFGDKPARSSGERTAGERPRWGEERPARPFGDRPPRRRDDGSNDGSAPQPASRPRGEFGKAAEARPPRHERKQWSGEARPAPVPSPLRDDGSIRLSKRMTELGLCSRREADEYIEKGWVRVDGRVVSELGSRVKPGQKVELDRRGQTAQDSRVTILLNKPVGYVSGQAEDGYEPASVLITAENRWAEDPSENRYLRTHHRGLAPAGRLDIDSIGLLVFTQDGRIARALIGDDSSIEKEYHVRVEGSLTDEGLKLLNHGLSLDGEALRPAKVSWLNEDQLRFVLREGKKRQIRRMCELVGLKVVGLKRVRIGRVMLGNLPPGQWRYLGQDELF
ncbi:MAG: pseudouridine synthase [Rhodocyclaceae bacterium]|nr:MAG: pseudouridine synthase [Rhodocyclaceae bacterium]